MRNSLLLVIGVTVVLIIVADYCNMRCILTLAHKLLVNAGVLRCPKSATNYSGQ